MRKFKVFKIRCLNCKQEFRIAPGRREKAKYCSYKCMGENYKENCKGKKMPWDKGTKPIKSCEVCNQEFKTEHYKKDIVKFCSRKCSDIAKREYTGERSNFWKGGTTPINKLIRSSIEYEEWRTKVFERDLYTCQGCGEIGGYLEADHIKPFALYPELRFEVDNGRTLCKPCHRLTETFGRNSWIQNKEKLII